MAKAEVLSGCRVCGDADLGLRGPPATREQERLWTHTGGLWRRRAAGRCGCRWKVCWSALSSSRLVRGSSHTRTDPAASPGAQAFHHGPAALPQRRRLMRKGALSVKFSSSLSPRAARPGQGMR
ncbi:hypothetical protein NN561_002280 [Cricetulus griseus]